LGDILAGVCARGVEGEKGWPGGQNLRMTFWVNGLGLKSGVARWLAAAGVGDGEVAGHEAGGLVDEWDAEIYFARAEGLYRG
jgi:hypothetical protein